MKVSLIFFGILVEAASILGQGKRETKLYLPVIQKYWKMSFFFFLPPWSCLIACRVLSSLTRDRTHAPGIGMRSLNHWTTKKVPERRLFRSSGWKGQGSESVAKEWERLHKIKSVFLLVLSMGLLHHYRYETGFPHKYISSLLPQPLS